MSFKAAASAAPPPVNRAYRPGKGALQGAHRRLVDCDDPRRLTGSINLDLALAPQPPHANEPRWDYGVGYRTGQTKECAVWIEIHSADTSDVKVVLNKLKWLRDWLRTKARTLESLTGIAKHAPSYVWIATGGVHIPPNSPQFRNLSQSGLMGPLKKLRLP